MIPQAAPGNALGRVGVIIPALNEAANLCELLPRLAALGVGQTIVADNGSTDATRDVAEAIGATWVFEPRRGYGAACFAGLRQLADHVQIVAFLDADLSDDPALLPALVQPISAGTHDLVIGSRAKGGREPGAMSAPQRFANWLFPLLIRIGWGYRFTDLGPFRAVRRSSLDAMRMEDRAFGWTIEMQIRAVELKLRIAEWPVPYRRRLHGASKVSGSLRGVLLAAYWITRTCVGLWLTKRSRIHR